MPSGLIIVVDDNPSFRKLYSDYLSVHGYTVMTASGGLQAMKLLLNCTPKVLILDISMPHLDGIETCKRIRRTHGGEMAIVFLTSFNDVERLRDCMNAGGDDYMIKSDKLEDILERIKFWSMVPNRSNARLRRSEVVQEISNAIERIEKVEHAKKPARIKITQSVSKSDDTQVDLMSRLMSTAQSLADTMQLTGRDKKLYMIGYAAGIVSYWSDIQKGVKIRYFEYLRAALSGSYFLRHEDITEAIENFDELSTGNFFLMGRKRARVDCQSGRDRKADRIIVESDTDEIPRTRRAKHSTRTSIHCRAE